MYIEKLPKGKIIALPCIVFFLFVIILLLGFFINKPDTVDGSFKLVAMSQPIEIFAPNTGKIVFIASSNDTIEENQDIAFISNSVDLSTVNFLACLLDTLNLEILHTKLSDESVINKTGQLYPSIALLNSLLNKHFEYDRANIFDQNLRLLELELNTVKEQIQLKSASLIYDIRNLDLISEQLSADSILYLKGAIVVTDLEKRYRDYANQKMRILNEESSLYQLKKEKSNKELNISLLKSEYNYNKKILIHDINKAIASLRNDILLWKKEYVVTAPTFGILELNNNFEDNNIIRQGYSFARLLPVDEEVIGHIIFPSNKSNRLQPGMDVRLYLDSYPNLQNGYLKGSLFDISPSVYLTPDDKSYHTAKVKLDINNQPYFKEKFKLVHNMTGKASVVIEEKCLFEQLLYFIKLNT